MTKVNVIKSNRKSISLEITKDLSLIVRAPYFMTDNDIKVFLDKKILWINSHLQKMAEEMSSFKKMTFEEVDALADEALAYFPPLTAKISKIMGVEYNGITIRNQKTRWGSCSSKGNLNFNCLLMLAPESVRQYVVIHELCHLTHMNHSPAFWALVEKYCPNFKEEKKWLKDNGNQLIRRISND